MKVESTGDKIIALSYRWLNLFWFCIQQIYNNILASSVFHLRMRQLGVIRDKQAFSAAEIAQKEYFSCGPSPEIFCLSRMTSELN